MRVQSVVLAGFIAIRNCYCSNANSTVDYTADLLSESMSWLDMYYDSDAGYLYSLSSTAPTHDTRSSAWYAAGLFARNEGGDVDEALKIITNVIEGQHKNVSAQWFGT